MDRDIKVLLVEDDPMVRRINGKFLEKMPGFHLSGAVDNLEEARERILEATPDLVLLDVFFPRGTGVDLLKWIRKNDLEVDAIMITADKHSGTVEEAFRYGAVDYLLKPFQFQRFAEALESYRDRREAVRKPARLSQEAIDRLGRGSAGRVAAEEELVANATKEKILAIFRDNPGTSLTAAMVAEKIGASRITARKYLDALEQSGVLAVEAAYGTVGRPKNMYHLPGDTK
ncbi:response regulator [Anaerotalea alkaliphila]|uniref:Transcriptional regulatory protein n=1 Tax=Anaerotalea alkaliphila TaxID=2662126 RepID=A0A7X5HTW2_9FIRM|nr:response regulator [Anaerotalea alkaliphila]NDL66568.1 response regulator [Anaerotalea alkaliphila]